VTFQQPVVAGRRAGGPAKGEIRGAYIQGGRAAENEQHAGGQREEGVHRREPRPGRSVRASVVRRAHGEWSERVP